MPKIQLAATACLLALSAATAQSPAPSSSASQIFGFRNAATQLQWDATFLKVPDAALAGQHLKTLTAEPHWASSPEDYKTAEYVAARFKAAGLRTEIVPYRVLLNKPISIRIEAFDEAHHSLMSGPTREFIPDTDHGGDPFQGDARILPAFNGSSPSGDVTGEVVYANYGKREDFEELSKLGVSVKGKIVLVRYGGNFRGVKVYIAQQHGAAGVLIYSDPADDGYARGDMYPAGAMRPESAVQRGSTQFLPIYPGDPETPGIASTLDLPETKRLTEEQTRQLPSGDQPSIPANPLSYRDAAPILRALSGAAVPHEWQGALPFTYHLGGGATAAEKLKASASQDSTVPSPSYKPVTVHMALVQDTRLRTIWDVVGTIPGSDPEQKNNWVVAGNHRDAWVFGAVDPNSGTAAMLETAHGLGELLKAGWKPKRTIVLGSWDAEEEGLIGSTEWAEQHAAELTHAVAYFNTDVAVSGPDFNASAVPSLKQFIRDVALHVPSPKGGSVWEQWSRGQADLPGRRRADNPFNASTNAAPAPNPIHVGDLGSGSDYTPFMQHLGVPSIDIGSDGPYGVYHSAFDNYAWFLKNADPTFVYEQQQARVFGLEILHMADADVLPYDDAAYGSEILSYIDTAKHEAADARLQVDFSSLEGAAHRFASAGSAVASRQRSLLADGKAAPAADLKLNTALRAAETALLNPAGLPQRPWYKHTVYAPGEFTGYAAVVIPGVTEGIEARDLARTETQLQALAAALNNAAGILEAGSR